MERMVGGGPGQAGGTTEVGAVGQSSRHCLGVREDPRRGERGDHRSPFGRTQGA